MSRNAITTKPAAGEPPVLDLAETAALLRLSEEYVRKLVAADKGPRRIRVGRRLLFRRVDVLAWVDSRVE